MDPWWQTASLVVEGGRLTLDGVDLDGLARTHGTPLYAYSGATVRRQLGTLREALATATADPRVYYAMKANRFSGVLAAVREVPGVGVDCCSPAEVRLALASGFAPHEISFMSGMLSERDVAVVAEAGVRCILDSHAGLRRYGRRVPAGTRIGLRVDPEAEVAYRYGRAKFGFELGELEEALGSARAAGLVVDGLHVHLGWNLAEAERPELDRAFAALAAAARRVPGLEVVNVGGGLGGRYRAEDAPLSVEAWAELLRRHLGPLGVAIACEPGTFVARPAGVLLVEVNTSERRRGVHWVGVDAGFAINEMVALYRIPLAVIPTVDPLAAPAGPVTVVGHMNDAIDVWARELPLPPVREGDVLALFPCGAYGSSMRSDHCLRGELAEVMVS